MAPYQLNSLKATAKSFLPWPDEQHGDPITVSLSEYKSLVQSRREYFNLRRVLLSGGVDVDTLDVLIATDLPHLPSSETSPSVEGRSSETFEEAVGDAAGSLASPSPQLKLSEKNRNAFLKQYQPYRVRARIPAALTPESESCAGDTQEIQSESLQESARGGYSTSHENRSIVLTGVPRNATLSDVANVIRGGAILQMFLRERCGYAHVSFVNPAAAQRFLLYSERDGLRINGKKVDVAWDPRQTYLKGSLAHRITSYGATRNLVIRFVKPHVTADSLRLDLEHIHRLEIVDIRFENGHAFVSLNNVALALTARNCMHSQAKYKGMRIDFYPDECDQPSVPARDVVIKNHRDAEIATEEIPLRNRFEVLFDYSPS